jgi:transcriptional regulator
MVDGDMEVLQGTLDLLVLKALTVGSMHGYNILAWLRRATDGKLQIVDAALYPALHRMEARGLIESEWGLSENKRRAKFYNLTVRGRRELEAESASWNRYAGLMAKVLSTAEGG